MPITGIIYVLDLPLSTPGSVYQALLDSSATTMVSTPFFGPFADR